MRVSVKKGGGKSPNLKMFSQDIATLPDRYKHCNGGEEESVKELWPLSLSSDSSEVVKKTLLGVSRRNRHPSKMCLARSPPASRYVCLKQYLKDQLSSEYRYCALKGHLRTYGGGVQNKGRVQSSQSHKWATG